MAIPVEGERNQLRLLLNHRRGRTSFDDLLTFHGIRHSPFREAAQNYGLLESDNSLSECLFEAANFHFAPSLRRLFATNRSSVIQLM